MFPLSLALATVAILTPEAAPIPSAPLPSFQACALAFEMMDPREARYVFSRREDLAADVKLIRRRAVELAAAPPACDFKRFPAREFCSEMIAFNLRYQDHLDARRLLDVGPRGEWIDAAEEETRLLYHIWDTARDANCPYHSISVRRKALLDLRKLIGPEAYYAGCLPPPVPVWRFQRID